MSTGGYARGFQLFAGIRARALDGTATDRLRVVEISFQMGLGVQTVPMFKIYVGNLDPRVKIEQIRELFAPFATIEDAVLAADAATPSNAGAAPEETAAGPLAAEGATQPPDDGATPQVDSDADIDPDAGGDADAGPDGSAG